MKEKNRETGSEPLPVLSVKATRVCCIRIGIVRRVVNKKDRQEPVCFDFIWCPEEDSNLHASRH